MRKSIGLLGGVMALAFAAPVLAQDATPEATPMMEMEPWTCPAGFEGQTLSVYNWSTYVAEDTVSNFEAACGVSVIYDVYGNNEEMLARLRQGNPGYDIIVPTDYMVEIMISEGLLEEIDRANVPNFANVSEDLAGAPYDPDNAYSVPYQWGTQGFGYNLTATGEPITTWEQFFGYDGNVAWLDDLRAMMGVALVLNGFDANSTNPDEIAVARDYLIANGGNVTAIAADDGQALLERGDVDISYEFSGDIFQVMAEAEPGTFGYSVPSEAGLIWVDNMAIPLDAPNKALAEVFIDYILDPQVGADISNYTAYASPNQTAIDNGLIDEAYLDDPSIYPTDETRANLFFVTDVGDATQFYNDAWDEIKISLGR